MSEASEYTKKELEDINKQLERRYDSLARATQNLELKNGEQRKRINFLEEQLENAELNIAQQKTNLINVVSTSNQQKEDMAFEINELRAKIKRLENGDNNRLGN